MDVNYLSLSKDLESVIGRILLSQKTPIEAIEFLKNQISWLLGKGDPPNVFGIYKPSLTSDKAIPELLATLRKAMEESEVEPAGGHLGNAHAAARPKFLSFIMDLYWLLPDAEAEKDYHRSPPEIVKRPTFLETKRFIIREVADAWKGIPTEENKNLFHFLLAAHSGNYSWKAKGRFISQEERDVIRGKIQDRMFRMTDAQLELWLQEPHLIHINWDIREKLYFAWTKCQINRLFEETLRSRRLLKSFLGKSIRSAQADEMLIAQSAKIAAADEAIDKLIKKMMGGPGPWMAENDDIGKGTRVHGEFRFDFVDVASIKLHIVLDECRDDLRKDLVRRAKDHVAKFFAEKPPLDLLALTVFDHTENVLLEETFKS